MRFLILNIIALCSLCLGACSEKETQSEIPEPPCTSDLEQRRLISSIREGIPISYTYQEADNFTIYFKDHDAVTLQKSDVPYLSVNAEGNWSINGMDSGVKQDNALPVIADVDGFWSIDNRPTSIVYAFDQIDQADQPVIKCIVQTYNSLAVYLTNEEQLVVQHINNPPVDLHKKTLRVLDIGNSYTEDATHYLASIVQAAKIDVSDMCLYKAIRGGASFKNWYDIGHDQDAGDYYITKVTGGLSAKVSGKAGPHRGEQFRSLLAENEWDLIIIHQYSVYAPYYDRWNAADDGGYLPQLFQFLRAYQPNATIGMLLIHSYWSGYSGNKERSSLRRWEQIAQSTSQFCEAYNSNFIIPYGTAIQNMRSSSLNNEFDMTADGSHCASGLADYTAACCYFQALFAPRYNTTIVGNAARWSNANNEEVKYQSSIIEVNDHTASVAQQAATLAVENPYLMYEL